jgi:hypothetical protein
VFTTPTGGLVLRQAVAKVVKQAAKTAGVTVPIGSHDGRRSVITALWVDGGETLEDIASFVGHAKTTTTAGYVKRRGRRPQNVAQRAAELLDGERGVRNHPAEDGSNAGSNDAGSPRQGETRGEPRSSSERPGPDGSDRR